MTTNLYDYLTLCLPDVKPKTLKKYTDRTEFCNFFNTLKERALERYKWSGTPDTVDDLFFEKTLLQFGRAAYYKNYFDNIFSLQIAGQEGISLYGYPLKGSCMGLNGQKFNCQYYIPGQGFDNEYDEKAVICYDNTMGYPYIRYIFNAACRLSDLMRSMDVIAKNLKQPLIVSCPESEINTMKKALAQRDENDVVIFSTPQSSLQSINVWQNEVSSENLKTLWEHYYNIEAYINEILGVNSNDQADKKERLLVDEINANNEATELEIDKGLKERKKFCEIVNKEFGLNISVELNRKEREYETYEETMGDNDIDRMDGEQSE